MFVVTKIAELLAAPLNLLLFVFLASVVLHVRRRHRAARRTAGIAILAMVLLALLPWNDWVVAPLEDRMPPPAAMPERVDGIVVLGGAFNGAVSAARGQAALNGAAERVTAMVQLARRYPAARLVYTGGSGSIARQEIKEAPLARALLESLGMDCAGVVFEAQSRTTRENATMTRELMHPGSGETWLLVTSAAHMPRAVAAFRGVGWPVVPYPVDYTTTGTSTSFGPGVFDGALAIMSGLHEWGGLLYYRLRGWTDSLYPRL